MTLLTDLVRCAVQFETPADLLHFIKEWLLVYGEPKKRDHTKSMLSRCVQQFKDFKQLIKELYFPSDCDAEEKKQEALCVDKDKKFEILRIRNRLDLNLEEVPGGYRDFALKLKIGFFRRDADNCEMLDRSSRGCSDECAGTPHLTTSKSRHSSNGSALP